MRIYKTVRGTWAYKLELGTDPVTGKRKQQHRSGFKRKQDAERAAAEVKRSLERSEFVESTKTTFREAAEDWITLYSTISKPSSVYARRHHLSVLYRYFSEIPIQKITKARYQKMLLDLPTQYAHNTINGIHSTAKMVFKQAEKSGLIYNSPTAFAVIPKPPKKIIDNPEDDLPDYMEKAELISFLETVKAENRLQDYPLFYLLAYTGMRIGEVTGLLWSDIDFSTKTIKVTKTVYIEKGRTLGYKLLAPKTETSARVISMPQTLSDVLQAYRIEYEKIRVQYGSDWHVPKEFNSTFVFFSIQHPGYPMPRQAVQGKLDYYQKHINLSIRLHPHLFRHTHASLLAEAGIDLVQIMKRLGHTDAKTTKKIYLHVTKTISRDIANKFDSLLRTN